MLTRAKTYLDLYKSFRWRIPRLYNIGVDVCDKHPAEAPAILHARADGTIETVTFGHLRAASNRLANALIAKGVRRGDRVAILLTQRPETAIAHIATYKAGMIAVPLFTLFGEEALEYRLGASGARVLITDADSLPKIEAIRDRLPDLQFVVSVDGQGPGILDWTTLLERSSDAFQPAPTLADDPALIIFTSGTTGQPKGALHAHRVLLGHLPGVELPQEFFPEKGDRFWTPADWAWIGGLIDVLLPSLHHGVPVVAHRMAKFDPEQAFALMARHDIRNAFLPPTALKLMRQVPDPHARHPYKLRSIGSGGETLGAEILDWGRATFGLTINEFYGQTECNLVLSNCATLFDVRPGSMGRPVPGHDVAVIDAAGVELPAGETGMIAVRRGDPVQFLGYWNNEAATAEKYVGPWLVTGDSGYRDHTGYFWYVGRQDDVITSGGYRIGPGEVEDCLMRHPAVQMAAVIGVPDPVRTELVKAVIVLKPGQAPSDALKAEIQDFVKERLAAHEYPRIVEFAPELPMTATGKIMRKVLRAAHGG